MTDYYHKYLKYKIKYQNLKSNTEIDNLIGSGNKKLIIHISGTQGSGKSTLGDKIIQKYKNKINVFDLDNLQNDYMHTSNKTNYQDFLNNVIKNTRINQ